MQKEVDIKADDTLGSIYFEKLFPLGVEAMMEAVDLVRDGKAPKIPQDESNSTYESWCKAEDAEINWNQPVQEIFNLIRGANPQPGAWSNFNGKPIQIYDCEMSEESSGKPGDVIDLSNDSFTVGADDGSILVRRVRKEKDKMLANEFISDVTLKVGDKFGS